MRNRLFIFCFASAIGILTGCQKEQSPDSYLSANDQIINLVDQAWGRMASEDLFPENPSLGIEMLNEGIAADFLLDETYLDETPEPTNSNPANWYYVRDHSLIFCLRGLQLSDEQITNLKRGLRAYEACKEHAVQRARSVYRELRMEYQQVFQRLINAYRNGTLTEREFKHKIAALRAEFRHELCRLHLREKLDQAFKRCLSSFMVELHGILTERQWSAFVECYRNDPH
ncbi:MAG: hypothetical protein ABIK52_01960 [Bacteroidota bacterium]